MHAEGREKIGGDLIVLDFLRRAIAGKVDAVPGVSAQLIKGLGLSLPFEIGGGRNGSVRKTVERFGIDQGDDAVSVLQRDGVQKKAFGHAEDGGIRADAQGQGGGADESGEAMLPQHAEGIAHVLGDGLHQAPTLTSRVSSTMRPSKRWMLRSAKLA